MLNICSKKIQYLHVVITHSQREAYMDLVRNGAGLVTSESASNLKKSKHAYKYCLYGFHFNFHQYPVTVVEAKGCIECFRNLLEQSVH